MASRPRGVHSLRQGPGGAAHPRRSDVRALELGLYREALDAGQVVLDALDGRSELAITPTRGAVRPAYALVHQNRGGCYEYMGRYEDALGAYAVAEERYRVLGMTEGLGEILDNRGAILLLLGRGKEALAAHEAAAAVFAAAEAYCLTPKLSAISGKRTGS